MIDKIHMMLSNVTVKDLNGFINDNIHFIFISNSVNLKYFPDKIVFCMIINLNRIVVKIRNT